MNIVYRNSRFNDDDLILAWGDVSGMINAMVFSSASISLFDRPSQPRNQQEGIQSYDNLEEKIKITR